MALFVFRKNDVIALWAWSRGHTLNDVKNENLRFSMKLTTIFKMSAAHMNCIFSLLLLLLLLLLLPPSSRNIRDGYVSRKFAE